MITMNDVMVIGGIGLFVIVWCCITAICFTIYREVEKRGGIYDE